MRIVAKNMDILPELCHALIQEMLALLGRITRTLGNSNTIVMIITHAAQFRDSRT